MNKAIGALCIIILLVFGAQNLESEALNMTANPNNQLIALFPDFIRLLSVGIVSIVIVVALYNEFNRAYG